MSRIVFHSKEEDAEVRGWERAMAGRLCGNIGVAALRIEDEYGNYRSPLRRVVTGYLCNVSAERWKEMAEVWVHFPTDDTFIINGHLVDVFSTVLNTALVMGGDVIKFLARMHGQCEIHTYVEGPNRNWLAGIIEQGRRASILRPESGWELIINLLRSRDDGPVVMSYSVCESFPNQDVAQWEVPVDEDGNEDRGAWHELDEEARWNFGVAGLRTESNGLELNPNNWNDFYFNTGLTCFDVRAYADKLAKEKDETE